MINVHNMLRIGTCYELTNITERLKAEMSSRGFEPASTNLATIFWIPVPWCSSWVVGRVHGHLSVAFSRSGAIQTWPNASYPFKQQRPTAWITAVRYKCMLAFTEIFRPEGWMQLPSGLRRLLDETKLTKPLRLACVANLLAVNLMTLRDPN